MVTRPAHYYPDRPALALTQHQTTYPFPSLQNCGRIAMSVDVGESNSMSQLTVEPSADSDRQRLLDSRISVVRSLDRINGRSALQDSAG